MSDATKPRILVFGAGGHAKVVLDLILAHNRYLVAVVGDQNTALRGSELCGIPLTVENGEILRACRHLDVTRAIVAIGDNRARSATAAQLSAEGFELVSARHPSCVVGRGVSLGAGTVLMPGTVVNADAVLGQNVIVNTRASVDHDCVLGDAVHIAPGATLCGSVRVGPGTLIGAGATVLPNVSIGCSAVIAAGATVIEDVADGVTVLGTPARPAPRARAA